jgi:hypothetical protein
MADKKISELTAASALDGTELVPIVQGGETVRTTVALIAGEAAPGAPRYALQFNNPLGTFDGDADALWEPAVGMTLGGATEAAGVVTPGANDIALAVGNYAVPGVMTFAPGDATNDIFYSSYPYIVGLNAEITFGNGATSAAIVAYPNYISTADSGFPGVFGMDFQPTISSESSGKITNLYGGYFSPQNYASAGVTNVLALVAYPIHDGGNTLGFIEGIDIGLSGSGDSGDAYGMYIANTMSGSITNVWGLYVEDHSGIGSSTSLNIISAGATSLNVFEGNVKINKYIEQTEMTAPSAPAANGVRIYAQDNGAGKTQLMALFASGAAQQIAIEP